MATSCLHDAAPFSSSLFKSAARMADEISKAKISAPTTAMPAAEAVSSKSTKSRWMALPSALRWILTSTDHIIAAEKRLLSLVKTAYVQEKVDIGSGPPGSKIRWFRSTSNEASFINRLGSTTKMMCQQLCLSMDHGYGASQGFFFRNIDALGNRFRVIAIDQLRWGGSSRLDFTCKSTEETEEPFEEWRKAEKLSNFILRGHSFVGYVASKYAIKVQGFCKSQC